MDDLHPCCSGEEKPRGAARTRDAGAAAPESDKDSGYSDVASECLSSVEQTDPEDCAPSSLWSHHPPLLLLKSLQVDQGSTPDPPPLQSWALHPSFQLLPTSSQILVFPPSIPSAKSQPVCKKSTKYLPILNSYTKIAPHPPSELSSCATRPHTNKRPANPSHLSQAKRLASGLQRLTAKGKKASTVRESRDVGWCEQDRTTPPKGSDETASADRGDPRAASSHSISHSDDGTLPAQEKQNKSRRFHNTLDVLRRSGLLSIAMKTKELARLNQATQVQLERLQEHVAVYSKAVCSNDPDDWQTLHCTLAGSHRILGQMDM